MQKRVLIISASPRKGGNSDTLCNEVLRGAKEAGHSVEKIFLREKEIGYCTGGGVCNTTHSCVQKDDMEELLEKMVQADVLVLAYLVNNAKGQTFYPLVMTRQAVHHIF